MEVCHEDVGLRTTFALVLAASESVAPIKFATLVEAAIETGKGI